MYEEHIFGVLKKNDNLTEYSLDSVVRHEDNVPGIETMDVRQDMTNNMECYGSLHQLLCRYQKKIMCSFR